jgi:hypothetical protein
MARWTVIERHPTAGSTAMHVMTVGISSDLGLDDYTYTIEDERGNRKTVIAHDRHELGSAISEGNFHEVDETDTSDSSGVRAERSESSDEEGFGSKFVQVVGGIFAFVVFMAFIPMVAPAVGRFFEALLSFAFIAAIGWGIFIVVRKVAASGK